jgi:uncharacterized protein YndB with AHSA1/START domain
VGHGGSEKRITVERVIAAPAEKIFDVLADPAQHVIIDGSGTVKSTRGTTDRLSKGARFGMSMRLGLPYLITNTVVEFEENRRIGWWHPAHNLWLYELEPVDGGTRVRESFDWSRSRAHWLLRPTGFLDRNEKAMEKTLERLDVHVTGGPTD